MVRSRWNRWLLSKHIEHNAVAREYFENWRPEVAMLKGLKVENLISLSNCGSKVDQNGETVMVNCDGEL